jgi:transposase InsO family protein
MTSTGKLRNRSGLLAVQSGKTRTPEQIIEWRGKPAAIRCDNGPEYTSHELINWAEDNGIKLNFIQPGNPQQNGLY